MQVDTSVSEKHEAVILALMMEAVDTKPHGVINQKINIDKTSVCSQNHVKSTEDTCVLYQQVSRFSSVNQPASMDISMIQITQQSELHAGDKKRIKHQLENNVQAGIWY